MPWFQLTGDERIVDCCASEDCAGQPTWRLEAGGVGSNYCSGCKVQIEQDGVAEALRTIEGNCALLFERVSEPAAWAQRQALQTLRDEIERLREALAQLHDGRMAVLPMRLITPQHPTCCNTCGCISWPGQQVYEGALGVECVECRERDWEAVSGEQQMKQD